MNEVRCTIKDSLIDMIVKMSEGNPGAMTALTVLISKTEEIDPQNMLGGLGSILTLDTFGIYGTDIYILYNDKCNRDIRKFIMLIRSVQLGFLSNRKLKEMGSDQTGEVDLTDDEWAEINIKVCDSLEDFQKE